MFGLNSSKLNKNIIRVYKNSLLLKNKKVHPGHNDLVIAAFLISRKTLSPNYDAVCKTAPATAGRSMIPDISRIFNFI